MTWYLVNGDVYMEHRFLKKTLKLEEGRIFVLPPDTRPEEGAHIYNAAGKKSSQALLMYIPRRSWRGRQCRNRRGL